MLLRHDAPIDTVDLDDLAITPDPVEQQRLFDFLEFRTLGDRLAEALGPGSGIASSTPRDELVAEIDEVASPADAVALLGHLEVVDLAAAWEGEAGRSPLVGIAVVTDGTTSTVVVTINGTNDAAVISAGTGSVIEDVGVVGGTIATGGTLTVTDVDSGQASFQAQASTAGTYGTFTLGTNGAWTYTASNSNPAVTAASTAGATATVTTPVAVSTVKSTPATSVPPSTATSTDPATGLEIRRRNISAPGS